MTYRARCEGRITRRRLRRAMVVDRALRRWLSGEWYGEHLWALGLKPIVPWNPTPEYLAEHLPPLQAEIDRLLAEIAENGRGLVGMFAETQ